MLKGVTTFAVAATLAVAAIAQPKHRRPARHVVAPPTVDAEAARIAPPPPSFIVYPRNGQSAARADADRAFEACMDGRGHTVR